MVISPRAPQASDSDAATRDARTRDRVLAMISERGPITAADLAALLGLTATGVRRHLDQLAETGAVTSRAPHAGKRGRGRPAREWVVGDTGHERLASDYDDLATDAVRFVRDTAGPEAVRAFADQRMSALEARCAAQVDAAGDHPRARTEALVSALRAEGYAASARTVGDDVVVGLQLCQGHCPVQHVAAEFPELCEAETDAFSRLLGVHVQRLATLAQGDHVCTTFVPTAGARPHTERSTR
ncbi:helix-turn-helix domain-containing protein [Janibacter sp. CX7]|uniref:helix-turn-helix transcriptional regulator n=1 Tax=Janibacter sp. CX7 TaxID=2963431 RepID=UPI0020CC6BEA|nr:helix-turn-helix domain-containing protein [Janibacter sp. CX7]UTT64750.1 helix-turn-helix domain-containing protein [Janibacter sp. CX7]